MCFFLDFWRFFRSIRESFANSPNLRPALHTPGLPLLYALRSPTTSRLPSHLPPQICHLSQSCIQIYHIVNSNWVVYTGILYLKKLLKTVWELPFFGGFCRFCLAIHFFHPRHNSQWPPTSKDFYTRFYPLFSYTLFLRKSQYFAFQCWVLNKGTTGTIFITSLVWRGPWLGIEPGTSRTRGWELSS